MMMIVRALYTNGVQPLMLAEGETVEVTITPAALSSASEAEMIRRLQASQTYRERLEVTNDLPPDDGGYDIVHALDENRRLSGERLLLPDVARRP